jgi:hypothetical protein
MDYVIGYWIAGLVFTLWMYMGYDEEMIEQLREISRHSTTRFKVYGFITSIVFMFIWLPVLLYALYRSFKN